MSQVAPYPNELADLVDTLAYRADRGWEVRLLDDVQRDKPGRHAGESRGLTLVVTRVGPDSYDPGNIIGVNHYFPVPPATYDRRAWRRWLFDSLGKIDDHERMEDFVIRCRTRAANGCADCLSYPDSCHERHHTADEAHDPGSCEMDRRPFAPHHGPGRDPYTVHELATAEDVRTSFRGDVSPLRFECAHQASNFRPCPRGCHG